MFLSSRITEINENTSSFFAALFRSLTDGFFFHRSGKERLTHIFFLESSQTEDNSNILTTLLPRPRSQMRVEAYGWARVAS